MLTLSELKKKHDKSYTNNQITREQGSDDLVFFYITQWSDNLLASTPLEYRGEFNILRKAGRQIMADLRANPVQPDFKPKEEARDDDAEVMDGIYRADDRKLSSQEAYDFAQQDAVVCGYGAWELYTEYATNRIGDENQVIKRRYIPEANNTVFFDPNATSLDKSDADWVSVLTAYSEEAYEDLVKDLTGDEDYKFSESSFAQPEQSYTFPWVGGEGNKIYVSTFYQREKVKDKVVYLTDPFGNEMALRESDIEEQMDELIDSGFDIRSEKEIMRWEVRKYIASGEMILNGEEDPETGERTGEVIAGENIPVVPCYGEYHPQIEGQSYWCGVTRLAKDPQRLRNFQMSYLADIVSRSPREKPIYHPEQIQGFEFMYEQAGAENNYPYKLMNRKSATGEELPIGPVGYEKAPDVPQALAASIQLSREAVDDVANAGLPQDIADPDLSGKAVRALQARIDQQSYIYQHNFKHAKKRDAEVYASMASEIHDTPKTLTVVTPDGQTRQVQMMHVVVDEETGEPVVLNDLTNMEFDVYAEIGPSYDTQKQQTIEQLGETIGQLPPEDPLRNILLLKQLEIMPGVNFDDVREHARKQLVFAGIKEPETEEEMAMLQQASQPQPDANMVLALAEKRKAEADAAEVQRKTNKDIMDAQAKSAELQLKNKDLDIKQAQTEIDAFETGVDVRKTLADTESVQIDNQTKKLQTFTQMYRGQLAS